MKALTVSKIVQYSSTNASKNAEFAKVYLFLSVINIGVLKCIEIYGSHFTDWDIPE